MTIQLRSRRGVGLLLAWVFSLAVTAWAHRVNASPAEQVLSGSDVGFRVSHVGPNDVPIGTLVVKINGKWVEPQFGAGPRIVR